MNTNSKYAAILDFETTGLDPASDKIIEAAVALVEVTPERLLGQTTDTYASFNDPGIPISDMIVRLTGITDEMVRGKAIDWSRFNAILGRASLLVSHNVAFDRPWLEKYGAYATPASALWACSLRMIDWSGTHGLPCRTLKHLAWEHDHFPNAHRAIDDVNTLVHLLRLPSRGSGSRSYSQELFESAAERRRLVLATGAPFETKDLLRERGFRWAPERRVWWKTSTEKELPELLKFMEEKIYSGKPRQTVSDPVDTLDPSFKSKNGLA